jgi:hypothetical protein
MVIELLANLELVIDPANIVFVTVPVSPVVTIVPETFGNVQVLAAVKSAEVIVPVKEVVPFAIADMIIGS